MKALSTPAKPSLNIKQYLYVINSVEKLKLFIIFYKQKWSTSFPGLITKWHFLKKKTTFCKHYFLSSGNPKIDIPPNTLDSLFFIITIHSLYQTTGWWKSTSAVKYSLQLNTQSHKNKLFIKHQVISLLN